MSTHKSHCLHNRHRGEEWHHFNCYSDTTSSRVVSHQGKSLVSFGRLRMTGDWRHGENIVHMRMRSGPRWPDRTFHLHDRYMRLEHPKNLVVAERSISLGHLNQLHNTAIPCTKPRLPGYMIT
jgi:hypothetical protein